MIPLPHNCKCSELNVYPSNWKASNASTKKDWYISYYFYDADNIRTKIIVKSGINRLKTLSERKAKMTDMLTEELIILKQGANPVTKKIPSDDTAEIQPETPFITAIRKSFARLKLAPQSLADYRSMLNAIEAAAIHLRYADIPITDVRRKHIKLVIEKANNDKGYSAYRFNRYRTQLMVLFSELVQLDAIQFNPCREITKERIVRKIKEVLTKEERKLVNEHLKKKHYNFWRFIQIFYHSGAREIELLRLKGKDIDLTNQRFKVTIYKRRNPVEMWRTIKDIALPLWTEIMANCTAEMYVFSEGLKPMIRDKPVRTEHIQTRWYDYVQEDPEPKDANGNPKTDHRGYKKQGGLGIKKSLYSLKYSHATDTAELLGNLEAAKHMGHTDETMVKKVYNVEYENRKRLTVKELRNEL